MSETPVPPTEEDYAWCQDSPTGAAEEIARLETEVERLSAEARRALDYYDLRSELYPSDADVAARMAGILRTVLKP